MTEAVGVGLRALVVDDEEVVRSVVLEVLEGMGFAVGPADSLAQAREKVAGGAYDLLVVDKNLPDGSGLALVRELGERDVDAQIVLMSGYATLSSAVEALQAGGAGYLGEPFDLGGFPAPLPPPRGGVKLPRPDRQPPPGPEG